MPGSHHQGSVRCLLLFAFLFTAPAGISLPAQNELASPEYSEYLEKAQEAMAGGKYMEAIQAFEKANHIRGNESPRCLFSLGWLYSELGEHEQAAQAYQRLFQLSLGESINHLQRLTVAYYRAGRPESAVEACQAFINRTTKSHLLAPAYNELGCWLLVRDGNASETLNFVESIFLKALDLSGGRANNVRLNLAEVLWRQGRKNESVNLLYSLVDQETAMPWRDLRLIQISEEISEHAVQISGIEPVAALTTPEPADQDLSDAIQGPTHVRGEIKAPVKMEGAEAPYTPEALRAGIQGAVVLQLVIDEQGDVKEAKVLRGLPEGLSESAVETVRTWKFKPATLRGKPLAVYYDVKMEFKPKTITIELGPGSDG